VILALISIVTSLKFELSKGIKMQDNKIRYVEKIFNGTGTTDGAGVKLARMFGGQNTTKLTDPFLMLDNFGSEDPREYLSGFPWHPHRGMETVTYMLQGKAFHEDSEGNKGVIYPGELQWMTAGSGIFHQEMPRSINMEDPEEQNRVVGNPQALKGYQLWINLPANKKMTEPTYRGIGAKDIPVIDDGSGWKARIIAGEFMKITGPFNGNYGTDPSYMDISMDPESQISLVSKTGYTSIIVGMEGEAVTGGSTPTIIKAGTASIMSRDESITLIDTKEKGFRFLFLSGKPLKEEIAWYGPIVMNNENQIKEALSDLRQGTFVREKNPTIQ
jgi:redox-sensitive bicupin YhaK (pirin superfamily)